MTTRGSAISRLVLATATMLAALPVAATARSDYPNRTVRIVVPTPPGAILDILPRIIADKLAGRSRGLLGMSLGVTPIGGGRPRG